MIVKRIKALFANKYLAPVMRLLAQGTTPHEIALALAGAFTISIFPIFGATTLMCAFVAIRFRLNLPLMQMINYSLTPVHLMLIIPFMRLGAVIFRVEQLHYSLPQIAAMVGHSPMHSLSILWVVTLQAIGAWCIVAPVVAYLSYKTLLALLLKIRPVPADYE
ncbi:MAG: DUF2062 domain-containing protein [Ignavibacteria bacterium]|nr:DUF2062 domain-containing protein [Ignavibacteria bacterium]